MPISPLDCQITAIARVYDAAIATRNGSNPEERGLGAVTRLV